MMKRAAFPLVVMAWVVSLTSAYVTGSLSAEDHLLPDEGSGSADEDSLSGLFSDVRRDVNVRCYKCTGSSQDSGCNVTLLRQSPETYLTDCSGHCVNITTGQNTIFDCTEKVPAKTSRCFQRDKVTMCVCGTDHCNGPPTLNDSDVMELPSSHQGIQLLSEHEVNVWLPIALRHNHNNDSSAVTEAANSGQCGVRWCGGVLFLVKFWLCFVVLKDYIL